MTIDGLLLVRHGESVGNVAREQAEGGAGPPAEVIPIDQRDPDVPLSNLGRDQATALGAHLAELPDTRIVAFWSSPYVRAVQTAQLAAGRAGLTVPLRLDERLRDRELGILDRLTSAGVAARFPDEAARRRFLGKMYYRPPGGESWADVALRLRSFVLDLDRTPTGDAAGDAGGGVGGTALIATHDAVILLFRYVLEGLTEQEVLDIAAQQSVGNASVTRLERVAGTGRWRTTEYGTVDHLTRHGSRATEHGAEHDVRPR